MRKPTPFAKLDAQEKALVLRIAKAVTVPIMEVGSILRPLNEFLTIDWPEGAVVKRGMSSSTPIVKLTQYGKDELMKAIGPSAFGNWKPIASDEFGDLMLIAEFIRAAQRGTLIDYDGIGYFATRQLVSDIVVKPSDVKLHGHPVLQSATGATHVLWYNK